MKTIVRMAVASVLLLVAIDAAAQPELYKKYSSTPGITKVYISPTMMELVGNSGVANALKNSDINISGIFSKLKELYIISTDNEGIRQDITKDFDKLVNNKKVELLMEASDGGDDMYIYCHRTQDIINSIYIRALQPNESTIIMLNGEFTMNDVKKIMSRGQ